MNSSTTRATRRDSRATSRLAAGRDGRDTRSLGGTVRAALLGGVVAAAVVALLHLALIEPIIERAIQIEEQSSTHQSTATPVVSRATQRWGLGAGLLLYGAVWGTLFGLLAHVSRSLQPRRWSAGRWGFFLAIAVGWSVSLLPFLKYPANPPGVGEPDTISYRQGLYFGLVALSVIGTALAAGVWRLARGRGGPWGGAGRWIPLGVYALFVIIVFILMPANPDPLRMPARLVWTFRMVSFFGLVVFWTVLGVVFARLINGPRQPAVPSPAM